MPLDKGKVAQLAQAPVGKIVPLVVWQGKDKYQIAFRKAPGIAYLQSITKNGMPLIMSGCTSASIGINPSMKGIMLTLSGVTKKPPCSYFEKQKMKLELEGLKDQLNVLFRDTKLFAFGVSNETPVYKNKILAPYNKRHGRPEDTPLNEEEREDAVMEDGIEHAKLFKNIFFKELQDFYNTIKDLRKKIRQLQQNIETC